MKAKVVSVPSSTSGIFLVEEVFPRLGIANRVNVRMTPRGSDASAMVASGEAELGLLPVSEIMAAAGVELAGVIAEEIQLNQVFAAAVVKGSKAVDAAKRLIAFLASERAAPAIRAGGMEPLDKR
jgi:molybdate transport system substrate-binding protein